MTKEEKKQLQKIPAKKVREMYANLVDDLRTARGKASGSGKIGVDTRMYIIGWQDGHNVARRRYQK